MSWGPAGSGPVNLTTNGLKDAFRNSCLFMLNSG